jgi:hypothetical protein
MPSTLALRSPADILNLVPYLLGFHPAESLVLIGVRAGRVIFQLRGDLGGPPGPLADYYAAVAARQQVTDAVVIGYGAAAEVGPLALALAERLAGQDIHLVDVLRVTGGRYWSYLCDTPDCCPPQGHPLDPAASPVATAAVVAGHVALPSRSALERMFAPVTGPALAAIQAATERADRRVVELVESAGDDPAGALRAAGAAAVDGALDRQRAGGRLDDDELAWLTVLLIYLPVRDHACYAVDGDLDVHLGLWTDVLRRAEPDLSVAPATLLGFTAWRAGEGAVASIAVERALSTDPDYELARLLAEVLAGAIGPAEWPAEWPAVTR